MKPFNLAEAKAGKRILNALGKLRIFCYHNSDIRQVVVLDPLYSMLEVYADNGGPPRLINDANYRLFMGPEKQILYTPIWRSPTGSITSGYVYANKEEALINAKYCKSFLGLATLEIEV